MRQSETFAVESMKAQTLELQRDRERIIQQLGHEQRMLTWYDEKLADELKFIQASAAESERRMHEMFDAMKQRSNAKIALLQEHLESLQGDRIPIQQALGDAIHTSDRKVIAMSNTARMAGSGHIEEALQP